MRTKFKRSLFGYNRKQVQSFLDALEKQAEQQRGELDERMKQVIEENINLAVELKVARAGYQDAAELMLSAQTRVRELENHLEEERARVLKLERCLSERQSQSAEELQQMVQDLQQRLNGLQSAAGSAQDVLSQMGRVTTIYEDGTRFEDIRYMPPEGIEPQLETDGARGLMQRLYKLRCVEKEQHGS